MTRRTADRWVIAGAIMLAALFAALAARAEEPKRDRLWKISMAAVAGASAADFATSVGKYERNGLLAGADGRFSPARGLAFKIAPQAVDRYQLRYGRGVWGYGGTQWEEQMTDGRRDYAVIRGKCVTLFAHFRDAYEYWRVCLGSVMEIRFKEGWQRL